MGHYSTECRKKKADDERAAGGNGTKTQALRTQARPAKSNGPIVQQIQVHKIVIIPTHATILRDNDEPPASAYSPLDTASELNVISQHFANKLNLTPCEDADLPYPRLANGKPVECAGAYKVQFTMADSRGSMRTFTDIFYALHQDARDEPMLWGLPFLKEAKILIDTDQQSFRWKFDISNIKLETATEFQHSLTKEDHVYALILSKVDDELIHYAPNNINLSSKLRVADDVTAQISSIDPRDKQHRIPSELQEYEDVFSESKADKLPTFEHAQHAIETTKDLPYGPLYNLSQTELEVLRKYLDDAIAKGWIRRSTSPAGAPVLFVPKKDNTLRLCVDYRGLNKVTIKNRHPLPLITETLDRLVGSKIFSKLDLRNAYHRVRIREGDEWKTTFRTRYGHFEYLVMPFGLTNAPATFQDYINRAMAGITDVFCVVYLDDILIFSDSLETHWQHVREVLARLRKFNLYAKLSKCEFATEKVEFLGFIVSILGVAMDESRVDTIRDWPVPKSFHDVQVFLGSANFYRRFINRYSALAAPLTSLLQGAKNGRKTGPFEWDTPQQQAFDELRRAFTEAPMLRHFDPERRIRLETDASNFACCAILSQLFTDDIWHPIAYWSRKFIPAERNYEVYDQELLAIVAAMKHWRHYVQGSLHPIDVLTDHNNLKGFMKNKTLTPRQARWAQQLSAVDFTITHRPGSTNPADGPSRRPDYDEGSASSTLLLPTLQNKLLLRSPLASLDANEAFHQARLQHVYGVNPTSAFSSIQATQVL